MSQEGTPQVDPEVSRTRARAVAAITASGAGAVTAAFVFSPTVGQLPRTAVWLGASCAILLLASTLAYSAASLRTRVQIVDEGDFTSAAVEVIKSVNRRSTLGSVLGLLGVVSLVAALLVVVLTPKPTPRATLVLTAGALELVQELCPDATNPVHVRLSGEPEQAVVGPLVSVKIPHEECVGDAAGRDTALLLPRASIRQIGIR